MKGVECRTNGSSLLSAVQTAAWIVVLAVAWMVLAPRPAWGQWTVGPTGQIYYNGGNVGVGTISPTYQLSIEGTIGAREVIVTNTSWSDYVFRPEFRLRPLSEASAFIQQHHDLPDIPSGAEVKEKRVSSLMEILRFNLVEDFLFFRVASGIVPFASHPVNQHPWQRWYAGEFERIGEFVRTHGMRLSFHPDQFTLINSPDEEIFRRSVAELEYHTEVFDLIGLDDSHKIQIHAGGVYGDRAASMARFVERYGLLSDRVRQRLVVENDDRLFSLSDCMGLHEALGIPVVFDVFHHSVLRTSEEPAGEAMRRAASSWSDGDGPLMVDYSSQEPGKRAGTHAESIDAADFRAFVRQAAGTDFDLMLEIKDKETSARRARELLRGG